MPARTRIAIRAVADPSVSSANPAATAPELADFDRRIGWLVVNRFTLPLLRGLGRLARPGVDTTDVRITRTGSRSSPTFEVEPLKRKGGGALLLFHGGGFVMGRPDDILARAATLACHLGIPVLCPAYRLAPASPFPAALDDALSAWRRLLDRAAALSVDPLRIVVGGYSAGGGLAACLTQKLRDEGGLQPAAQLLIYPMLDDRTAANRALDAPRHRVWSNRNNRFAWSRYLGSRPGSECPRFASAARCNDLAGLPPAWIGIGTGDLFLDESRAYADRLAAFGVPTVYAEMAGAIHGFDLDRNELAELFVSAQFAFISRYTN